MSKNIRNIIAGIFILTAFSAVAPNCLNFTLTKAYAENKPSLEDIYLSEGSDISFYKSRYSYILDLDENTDEIFIKAKPEDSLDTVKINGEVVTKEDYYKKNFKLEKGKNTINIEVIDDKTKSKSTYSIYVYRGGKKAVYLQDININGKTIGFDKTNTLYSVELDEGTQLVELKIIPGKGRYSITVNDVELNENNMIKLKFKKGIGKYNLNIGFKDEDTERVGAYSLNLYLGIPVSPNVEGSIENVLKPNQWVLMYGRWRYNDEFGVNLKDTWYYDNKYKSYFHFNNSGNMQTGWIEDGGKKYYLNLNGAMQTGWVFDNDNEEWYFLGSDGAMKSGWIKNEDKWYSLRVDGGMSTGWIVSKGEWYYLDLSGAMQTGWVRYGKKWYYLNKDGHMETGWIKDNDQWYFSNSDGSMKSGEWLYYNNNWYYLTYAGNMKYDNINIKNSGWLYVEKDNKIYYFNEDGTMRTTTKTIDGYTYDFNEDGSVS